VTAPVFVVDGGGLAAATPGSTVTVSGAEGRHAVTVRRIRSGEQVDVVDGDGRRVSGEVGSVAGKDAVNVIVRSVTDEPPPNPRVTVVQALAKGDRGELAVELLTEVGVDEIVPWSAANCVTQWRAERLEKSRQRWVDAAAAAAKQSRRALFPRVGDLASTPQVGQLIQSAKLALVLHESAAAAIGDVRLPEAGVVVVVVGPEGGISPTELAAFEAAGALTVRLGPSVLRTSSAGMAAVAALLSGSPRWSVPSTADVASDTSVEG